MSDVLNPFCVGCHKHTVNVRYWAEYERWVVSCSECGYVKEKHAYHADQNISEHNGSVAKFQHVLYAMWCDLSDLSTNEWQEWMRKKGLLR